MALSPDLYLLGRAFLLGTKDYHPVNLPSVPVFPWVCILPQLPLGRESLRDCLEYPPKKRVDASSLCCVLSEMCPLYLLNCLLGHGMLLLNCLEWHCPLLSCLGVQVPCILCSQLLT